MLYFILGTFFYMFSVHIIYQKVKKTYRIFYRLKILIKNKKNHNFKIIRQLQNTTNPESSNQVSSCAIIPIIPAFNSGVVLTPENNKSTAITTFENSNDASLTSPENCDGTIVTSTGSNNSTLANTPENKNSTAITSLQNSNDAALTTPENFNATVITSARDSMHPPFSESFAALTAVKQSSLKTIIRNPPVSDNYIDLEAGRLFSDLDIKKRAPFDENRLRIITDWITENNNLSPSIEQKKELVEKTKLNYNQISNYFKSRKYILEQKCWTEDETQSRTKNLLYQNKALMETSFNMTSSNFRTFFARKCKSCQFGCVSEKDIHSHIHLNHKKESQDSFSIECQFECKICNCSVKTERGMLTHFRAKHSNK